MMVGARWMSISQAASVVTQIAAALALARFLTPSEFGLVALVTLVQLFVQRVFRDLGTGAAIVQRPSVSPELLSSVFFLNVFWGLTMTVLVGAFAAPIAWALGDAEVTPLLRAASLTFVVSAFGLVPAATVRRQLRYPRMAVQNYCNFAGGLFVSVALAANGMGPWAVVLGGLSGTVISTLYAWWSTPWRPIRHFRRSDLREISSYSRNLLGYQLTSYLMSQGDRLIIGRFIGTAALGHYAMASRLFLTPVQFFGAIYTEVLFPAMARVQDDRSRVGETVVRATALGTFALAPLLVGLSVVARPLVEVALGDAWTPAAPVVSILAFVGLVQVIQTSNGTIFRVVGRTDLMLRWGVVAAVGTMLGYLAGSNWGMVGIAWGYLISNLVLAYPLHWMAFRLIDVTPGVLVMSVAPYVGSSGVMAAAVLGVREGMARQGAGPVVELAVAVAAGAVAYSLMMLIIRPPALKDAWHFVRISRSRPSRSDPQASRSAGEADTRLPSSGPRE